ncbi:uncharacterized protein HD556DRAFT_1536098 [Suillus plorans]|uniref:Uncharacterized protein n=1 Tax=Suillus plorans TaxID=116603 RepID=A0A9P7ARF0_9AGAM|nr:uncharacterized protein HD556DRAFT_1536098 [Suillus plorans]KAG1794651.1 hypothetical protein HD556DRAFT_1536098 [Suillus plorans]
MARKCDWDQALQDAIQSISIKPSLAGHISEGIAFCGKRQTIALFNANEHQEAILRIRELAACPYVNPVACHIVEAYLRVQLGNIALEGARHSEAVEHFTAAVNASNFFYKLPIHLIYDEFVVLFGWDLKSLWQTANQQQCCAFVRAGSFVTAIELYQSIMDKVDEDMKADLRAWFAAAAAGAHVKDLQELVKHRQGHTIDDSIRNWRITINSRACIIYLQESLERDGLYKSYSPHGMKSSKPDRTLLNDKNGDES